MNARRRRPTRRNVLPIAGALSLLLATEGAAQTFIPDPVEQTSFMLQIEKPFLSNASSLAAYSSILEADALVALGSSTLQIGLPVAVAGADFVDGTSLYAGNVRATLLFGPPGRLTSFIGLTLPTASNAAGPDLAILVGALPWLGELEKWVEDTYALSGAFLPAWPLGEAGQLGLRLGGAAIMPTDFENLNIDIRAAGWVRAPAGTTELRAELATTYMLTDDDGFGEQFTAYLDLGTTLTQSSLQPTIFLRLPLDGDGRELHDLSLGVALTF